MAKLVFDIEKKFRTIILPIIAILIVGFYISIPLDTYAVGKTWYWRPLANGPYNANNGTSHDNAWYRSSDIVWGPGGVDAGDTLYVCGLHDGGYLDRSINIGASGTVNTPIVVNGACPGDSGAILSTGVKFIGSTGWTDVGFGVYSRNYGGSTGTQVIEDGILRLKRETQLPSVTWQSGSFYQEGPGKTLYYKPSTGNLNAHTLYSQADTPIIIDGRHDVVVRNLTVKNAGTCIHVNNSQHVTLEGNIIEWCSFAGIAVWNASHDGRITGNTISNIKNGIYFVAWNNAENSDRWTVLNNTIHDVDPDGYYGAGDTHGIGIQGGSDSIFEKNHIYNNGGEGMVFYVSSTVAQKQARNTIRYNYIHDIKDFSGLGVNTERGIDFGSDNVGSLPENIIGNQVYGNILVNITQIALRTKSSKAPAGYTVSFFNNVIYKSGTGFQFSLASTTEAGNSFRNNIVVDSLGAHIAGYYINNLGGVDIDSNLYYPDGPGKFKLAGATLSNFSAWQSASNKDSSSTATQQPFFINTSGNFSQATDFIPQQVSPVINRGSLIPGYTHDYSRNSIINAPDLGAFEYQPVLASSGNSGSGTISLPTDTTPPSTPGNLTATTTSPTQTSLSWSLSSDNIGVANYRIKRGDALLAYVADIFYQEAGLSPATTYTYTVEAIDMSGNTSVPSSVSITTLSTPAQPIALPQVAIPSSNTTSTTTGTSPTLPTLLGPFSIGMSGSEVVKLQQMLIVDGSMQGVATGYYGPITQKGVETFQVKYNLVTSGTPDTTGFGLAGPGTRTKLNSLYSGGMSMGTDREALLASLRKQVADLIVILQGLITKLAAMKALQTSGIH